MMKEMQQEQDFYKAFVEKAIEEEVRRHLAQQEERIEKLEAQLDGVLWSPQEW